PTPFPYTTLFRSVHRYHFARIRPMVRVEDFAQLAHRVERALGEDRLHVAHLVETDAVLAGYAAAGGDAGLHDLDHRLVHPLALGRIIGAVGDVRVEISIAGVKHVTNEHVVFL